MEDLIKMNRRFLRSVNLVEDCRSVYGLKGYVVTPSVRKALARMQESFVSDETERAFTLTGPYGTGKSSFGLFLYHLLTDRNDAAWDLLLKADAALGSAFKTAVWGNKPSSKGYLVLTVTARRASVSSLLAECFDNLGDILPRVLLKKVKQLRESRDTKNSLRLVSECVKQLCSDGHKGVFFVFDEFGKVFEQARLFNKDTDVFLLQELAEAASRSGDTPMFFLGMLHQSFADYASIDTPLRKEFSKIEGRFEPISFVETASAQIHLVACAFPEEGNTVITKEANKIVDAAIQNKIPGLAGLNENDFKIFAKRSYPLHSLTLAALPLLFRRFGQNERSIFSYLTSNETNGLQDFARRNGVNQLIRLCDLYDYFFENFEVQLGRHPYGHAFLEANAVIHSKTSLSLTEVAIIKTVAVLTSLGMQSPIRATEELIKLAMLPETFTTSLHEMLTQSILVYRKFNKTYALWSGSDIDLRECYEDADRELGKTGFSVAETLRKFLPPMPIVAKRNSILKGSLRFFEMHYVDSPCDVAAIEKGSSSAAGKIVVCLPIQESEVETFIAEALELSKRESSVLFAVPCNISELSEALMEVRRLNWIEEHVHGLRDDRIALREVSIRKADANQSVAQYQYGLLDPRPAPQGGACQYVYDGRICDIKQNKDVSILLSDICDALYPDAPVILNELINKRKPSSQAASARNMIIKRLNNVELREKELLGMEGYPPERSIYESVLLASGMHRKDGNAWVLSAPNPESDTNLTPTWNRMSELIFEKREEPLVLTELCAELSKPPYGILDGLFPILVVAFYLLNRDEVSLYAEQTFLPEPQDSHFELMVRRLDLFSISGMHVNGTRQQIVSRLAAGLRTEPKVLAVVRSLYALMNSLPKYARETNAVPKQAQEFRRVFFDAKSPEKLLFVDLPRVFAIDEISGSKQDDQTFDTYFKTLNACTSALGGALPKLIEENRKLLLEACGFENSPGGWQALYDKASFLLARLGGSDMVPFLQNIVNTAGDWAKADQVMAYIQQAPMDKWTTLQLIEFKRSAIGISERFITACKPFEHVPAALSQQEREKADALTKELTKKFSDAKMTSAILRTALLACLEALDRKEEEA